MQKNRGHLSSVIFLILITFNFWGCVHSTPQRFANLVYLKAKGSNKVQLVKQDSQKNLGRNISFDVEAGSQDLEFSFLVKWDLQTHKIYSIVYDRAIADLQFQTSSNSVSIKRNIENRLNFPSNDKHQANVNKKAKSIVKIEKYSFGSVSTCMGFFVEKHKIVTNYHCISSKNICEGSKLSFVDGREKFKCSKLIAADQELDFALIETDKAASPGEIFDLDFRTFNYNGKSNVWALSIRNQESKIRTCSGLDGFGTNQASIICLEKQNCRLTSLLHKCSNPTIKGDSGSPVVNERGQVVGLLWGMSTKTSSQLTMFTPMRLLKSYLNNARTSDLASTQGNQISENK